MNSGAGFRLGRKAGLAVFAALLAASCFSDNSGPGDGPQPDPDCADLSAATFRDSTGNDHYKVISPNGGESFRVGDTMKVIVTSGVNDNEGLLELILFRDGRSRALAMPGLPRNAIDPRKDCVWRFQVPDSLGSAGGMVSLVSDSVKVRLAKYSQVGSVSDFSDGFFSILPPL